MTKSHRKTLLGNELLVLGGTCGRHNSSKYSHSGGTALSRFVVSDIIFCPFVVKYLEVGDGLRLLSFGEDAGTVRLRVEPVVFVDAITASGGRCSSCEWRSPLGPVVFETGFTCEICGNEALLAGLRSEGDGASVSRSSSMSLSSSSFSDSGSLLTVIGGGRGFSLPALFSIVSVIPRSSFADKTLLLSSSFVVPMAASGLLKLISSAPGLTLPSITALLGGGWSIQATCAFVAGSCETTGGCRSFTSGWRARE
jgi:hypothetical protein